MHIPTDSLEYTTNSLIVMYQLTLSLFYSPTVLNQTVTYKISLLLTVSLYLLTPSPPDPLTLQKIPRDSLTVIYQLTL